MNTLRYSVLSLATALLASSISVTQTQSSITVRRIRIIDTPGISQRELDRIVRDVEGTTCPAPQLENCIIERVRDQFQQRGYFKAAVLTPKLKPSTSTGKVDANVVVEPGLQYLLARNVAIIPVTRVNDEKREVSLTLNIQPEG